MIREDRKVVKVKKGCAYFAILRYLHTGPDKCIYPYTIRCVYARTHLVLMHSVVHCSKHLVKISMYETWRNCDGGVPYVIDEVY